MFAAINAFLTRSVTGYFLNKSLRFRGAASAYLNRTASADINTYTISMWVKRGTLTSNYQYLFSHPNSGNTDGYGLAFNQTTDTLYYYNGTAYATTAAYRDPAAWYHIVFSNNAGSFTIYVNGVSVKTGPATVIFSGAVMNLGRYGFSSTFYFDGELAEVNFVDGQALAPTSFGAFSTYNQWLPIKYAGTYGTNGFYLPFTNTTSTSTLVADSSGNGNNWTPNNISLTAGSTYDSLTDVPTLTSATVANYAVLNPLDKDTARGTISDANLKFAATAFSTYNAEACRATMGVTTGKWYYEFRGVTQAGTGNSALTNFTTSTQNLTAVSSFAGTLTNYIGANANIPGNSLQFQSSGYSASLANSTLFASYASGDVVNIAVDFTAGKIWVGKNGTWYNSGAPGAGTNATSTFTAPAGYNLPEFEAVTSGDNSNQSSLTVNFGQQPFTYTPPTGFLALNTFNI